MKQIPIRQYYNEFINDTNALCLLVDQAHCFLILHQVNKCRILSDPGNYYINKPDIKNTIDNYINSSLGKKFKRIAIKFDHVSVPGYCGSEVIFVALELLKIQDNNIEIYDETKRVLGPQKKRLQYIKSLFHKGTQPKLGVDRYQNCKRR